jgi:2-succinyl-5-enolpyruvyl-6-hydroxy-3-cyclohexene-1-carboxylate synthase
MLEAYHLPVFSFDSRGLSALSHGMVLKMSAQELLEESSFWSALGPFTFSVPESPHELLTLLTKFPTSEPALLHQLQEKIPNDSEVYIGNSLVIRYFELVQTKRFRVFGNRGVNGIDGQLSTAIGVAKASGRPLTCILGDLTTLYDLTAIKDLPKNLKLVIINNSGGRIFEALKLDQRIWLEHKENFEKIVRALGKTYSQRLSDFDDAQIIELIADPKHTEAFRREWEGCFTFFTDSSQDLRSGPLTFGIILWP